MHTIQLNVDDSLFDTVMNFLNRLPKNQLKIEFNESKKNDLEDGLDFGQFDVKAFGDIDGLEYQRKIRNEW